MTGHPPKGRKAPLFSALLPLLLLHEPARAQWEFATDAGARYIQMREFDTSGRELVNEHGWLPGLGVRLQYRAPSSTFTLAVESYRGDLAYDGSRQNGAAFNSDTATQMDRVRGELAHALGDTSALLAGLEYERWRRNIHGRGTVAGIDERYGIWRLLAGGRGRVLDTGLLRADFEGVLTWSQAEHVDIRFGNALYDEARLRTKPATGIRLGLTLQPATWTRTTLMLDAEWARTRRSADETLRSNGMPAGTVAQPEHTRMVSGVRVRYTF